MDLPKEDYLKLFTTMLTIRHCEESFVDKILDKKINCPVHLCSGQEAIPTGISAHLTSNDKIFGNHRSHGHFLAKGGTIEELISEVYCKEEGCSKGRGGSMHLIKPEVGMLGSAPIVGGTISLALGAALASKVNNDKSIAIAYFGDGATGEGVLLECLNFAKIKKLPIIFVCENNLYSTHMSIEEIRANKSTYKLAEAFDIKNKSIDGNDVLEVHNEAKAAIEHCRNGMGPYFLECNTYRFRGHVGPDDNVQGTHTDIRPEKELEKWLKYDPIDNLKKYLIESKLFSENELDKISQYILNEVVKTHEWAQKLPLPNKKDLLRYVFSE